MVPLSPLRTTHTPHPQVGMGGMECYERDFEAFLLSETNAFYKRKAAEWIDQASVCGERAVEGFQASHRSHT